MFRGFDGIKKTKYGIGYQLLSAVARASVLGIVLQVRRVREMGN